MKQLMCLLFATAIFSVSSSTACTTFFLQKNGQYVFGKNYDWMSGTGMVNTNLKGLFKSSLPLEGGNALSWTSKYGSTTFNQYGKEFPNGGMNETGLVVELMWLSESEYPEKDNRPGFSVLQWIQYQLDNCSTVDEVVATDKIIRITSTGTPQHYLVADSKGNVATIELLNGKMVVHRGGDLPYPVLANSTYSASVAAIKARTNVAADNSLSRFSRACRMVENYQSTNVNKPLIDYSFDILQAVAQPGFTRWSIVYDISNKKVYFKTSSNQQKKFFSLNDFNYSCPATALSYNMNQNSSGDISKSFTQFSNVQNTKMLKQAFIETGMAVNIKEELQNSLGEFAAAVACSNQGTQN
jgi:choloylglycine hydrolase